MINARNGIDLVLGKMPALQPNNVQSHVRHGFPGGFNVGWYIFSDDTMPGNVGMRSDARKLVGTCKPADDGIIADLHVSCQLYTIGKDHMITDDAVVRDMRVS